MLYKANIGANRNTKLSPFEPTEQWTYQLTINEPICFRLAVSVNRNCNHAWKRQEVPTIRYFH